MRAVTVADLRARLPGAEWVREYGDGFSVRLSPVAGRLLSDAVQEVQAAAGEGWDAFPSHHGRSPVIRLFRQEQP